MWLRIKLGSSGKEASVLNHNPCPSLANMYLRGELQEKGEEEKEGKSREVVTSRDRASL